MDSLSLEVAMGTLSIADNEVEHHSTIPTAPDLFGAEKTSTKVCGRAVVGVGLCGSHVLTSVFLSDIRSCQRDKENIIST